MKIKSLILIHLSLLICFDLCAEQSLENQMLGEWMLDLRPTPEAESYFMPFKITEVDGKTFKGVFYGTEFEDGIINNIWGEIHFAFTTADGRSSYHHSGTVDGEQIKGRTHSPGRQMLSVWTGNRTRSKSTQ